MEEEERRDIHVAPIPTSSRDRAARGAIIFARAPGSPAARLDSLRHDGPSAQRQGPDRRRFFRYHALCGPGPGPGTAVAIAGFTWKFWPERVMTALSRSTF